MTDPQQPEHREHQARRTTSARRGVVAAGAVGAVGAAIAIGVSIQNAEAAESADVSGTDQDGFARVTPQQEGHQDGPQYALHQRQSSGGQLAGPGAAGPSQGRSGGS